MVRALVPLLLLAVILSACAGADPKIMTGATLETMGQEFVSTHQSFTVLCKAQAIPLSDCTNFDAFRVKFQKAYPVLVGAWSRAVANGTSTASVTEDLLRLKDELVIYTLLAQSKKGK